MAQSRLTQTIKKVMPAVVSIIISKQLAQVEKSLGQEIMPYLPFSGETPKIPDELIDSHGMVKVGSGSGFIVDAKGIILTNKHVIADKEADYVVYTDDGRKFSTEILARDPIEDVAILKIPTKDLPIVRLGDSSKIELGEPVLAIGNALGIFKNTVSSGIVSGLSRAIQAVAALNIPLQELRGLIQTDAAINPGNSGGPLINVKGEAIGINVAVVFGAQNLSFALPINAAKRDLRDLNDYGRIKRPMLGLRYITIDDNLREKMGLAVDYGALILNQGPHSHAIIQGSPAYRAGLQEKDIVLECNGQKITRDKTIQDFLEEMAVGDMVQLKVLRKRREFEVKVALSERK